MGRDGKIYDKFDVTRTDGNDGPGSKHDGCDYFVLDVTHDPYALPALKAYAAACAGTHPTLSLNLFRWVRAIETQRENSKTTE